MRHFSAWWIYRNGCFIYPHLKIMKNSPFYMGIPLLRRQEAHDFGGITPLQLRIVRLSWCPTQQLGCQIMKTSFRLLENVQDSFPHLANGPWKKSLNFIFPTTYGIPKSSKPVSHWLRKFLIGNLWTSSQPMEKQRFSRPTKYGLQALKPWSL